MENQKKITFYFVSGENLTIFFPEELFNRLMSALKNNWDSSDMISSEFGINFSWVTHYRELE